MTSDGASPTEQIVEAVRRNNVDLLKEVIESIDVVEVRANTINKASDAIGNKALHLGALNGSYEAVDYILDQEGVEVDPHDVLNQDTPLHAIVRYSKEEPEHGTFMAEMLVDAGCDPRIRNKHGQKPLDLVEQDNEELATLLQGAEYAMMVGPSKTEDEEGEGDQQGEEESDSE